MTDQYGWGKRGSAAPMFVGGGAVQIERLADFLSFVARESEPEWLRSGDAAIEATHQVGNLDLVRKTAEGLVLTAQGREWLDTRSDELLFRILHDGLVYFGEMAVRLGDGGARVEDLLTDASEVYLLGWTSKDQVRRRLMWLKEIGLVEEGANRVHRLSEKGRAFLASVDVLPPERLLGSSSVETEQLTPAPPVLTSWLSRSADSRRMVMGFIPKDSVKSLSTLVTAIGSGIERSELAEALSKSLDLSLSSARMFIDTARNLNVHEYVGKETIAPTELGLEWLSFASELNLVRLLHAAYAAFGESLEVLGDEPLPAGDVHRKLFAGVSGQPQPSRTSTVLRRLSEAGAVRSIGYARFVITPVGRALMEELPMSALSSGESGSDVTAFEEPNAVDSPSKVIADELIAASTDINDTDRLERATAAAFNHLGVDARHIGGPGGTDVLLAPRSALEALGRIIVDSKTAASGQLREDSVNIETLKEHSSKYDAKQIVVVGPGFDNAGRLPQRAEANGIVLLTAARLGEMVIEHDRIPYSPSDIVDALTVGSSDLVAARRDAIADEITLVEKVLLELLAEDDHDGAEPITSRDIYRTLRRDTAASEDEVDDLLQFLASTRIQAVIEVKKGAFALPADLRVAAVRLRTLAAAFESAASSAAKRGQA